MKKSHFITVISICAAIALAGMAARLTAEAAAKKPSKTAGFVNSKAWDKLDLRFRQAWTDANAKGEKDRAFECLLKTTHPMSEDEKVLLKGAGFTYRSVIGTIVTGSVITSGVASVAELEFVQAIELAVPLTIK